eukprot:4706231-Pleurochrysis_carterae.AAC.1
MEKEAYLLPPVAGTVITRSRHNIDVSQTRREVSVRLASKRASDTPWFHFTPINLVARKSPRSVEGRIAVGGG